MRNLSRFRLRAHYSKVESCKCLGGSNVCDKCECAEVQDETHVLFYFKCFENWFQFLMLDENVTPAADQPESRAVGQPPLQANAEKHRALSLHAHTLRVETALRQEHTSECDSSKRRPETSQ
eukprot:732981-Pelagomonas_calceolata.AAC.1